MPLCKRKLVHPTRNNLKDQWIKNDENDIPFSIEERNFILKVYLSTTVLRFHE